MEITKKKASSSLATAAAAFVARLQAAGIGPGTMDSAIVATGRGDVSGLDLANESDGHYLNDALCGADTRYTGYTLNFPQAMFTGHKSAVPRGIRGAEPRNVICMAPSGGIPGDVEDPTQLMVCKEMHFTKTCDNDPETPPESRKALTKKQEDLFFTLQKFDFTRVARTLHFLTNHPVEALWLNGLVKRSESQTKDGPVVVSYEVTERGKMELTLVFNNIVKVLHEGSRTWESISKALSQRRSFNLDEGVIEVCEEFAKNILENFRLKDFESEQHRESVAKEVIRGRLDGIPEYISAGVMSELHLQDPVLASMLLEEDSEKPLMERGGSPAVVKVFKQWRHFFLELQKSVRDDNSNENWNRLLKENFGKPSGSQSDGLIDNFPPVLFARFESIANAAEPTLTKTWSNPLENPITLGLAVAADPRGNIPVFDGLNQALPISPLLNQLDIGSTRQFFATLMSNLHKAFGVNPGQSDSTNKELMKAIEGKGMRELESLLLGVEDTEFTALVENAEVSAAEKERMREIFQEVMNPENYLKKEKREEIKRKMSETAAEVTERIVDVIESGLEGGASFPDLLMHCLVGSSNGRQNFPILRTLQGPSANANFFFNDLEPAGYVPQQWKDAWRSAAQQAETKKNRRQEEEESKMAEALKRVREMNPHVNPMTATRTPIEEHSDRRTRTT